MKKLISIAILLLLSLSAFANVPVTFALDLPADGCRSWVINGVNQGIFRKYGIDLKIVVAGNSNKSALVVSTNDAQVGFMNFSSVVTAAGKETTPKVKTLMVINDKELNAIWVLPGSDIKSLDDIDGKTMATFPGAITPKMLSVVTRAQPKYIVVPHKMRAVTLVTGKSELSGGYMTTMMFELKKLGIDNPVYFPIGDRLPDSIGMVIAVNDKWANSNPDIASNLKKAMLEAFDNYIKNPAQSVSSLSGAVVSTQELKDLELQRAIFEIDNLILTPFIKQHGVNNISMLLPRLTRYTELLNDKLEVKNVHTAKDLVWFDR